MILHGRETETNLMLDLLKSDKSELLGVTGRRRVGKTYLIDKVYEKQMVFNMTGIQNGTTENQLQHFADKLSIYSGERMIITPPDWQQAFLILKQYLNKSRTKKKRVLFFDELPWLATPKSNFLEMLAHFWNDYLVKKNSFVLVICGSSTSWIANKVYNSKGGLHNRVTQKINLKPFTLGETKKYLHSKGIKLTLNAISELYMAVGGIPFYLNAIKKGDSPTTAIERMCFKKDGLLREEYNNLFQALYENASDHEAIVKALAKSRQGLSRNELIAKSKVSAGGPFARSMHDLILSGFVEEQLPYGKKKRGVIYRLTDPYCIFYNRFITANKKTTKGLWQQLSAKQSYKIWRGYAFENLCLYHLDKIKAALGISGVYTETSSFRQSSAEHTDKKGFQIDILIDRADNAINICECKYHEAEFTINHRYATQLRQRKAAFREGTKTKKLLFTTMVTNYPLIENAQMKDVVDAKVLLKDLF